MQAALRHYCHQHNGQKHIDHDIVIQNGSMEALACNQ
jgi:hypothetical protein